MTVRLGLVVPIAAALQITVGIGVAFAGLLVLPGRVRRSGSCAGLATVAAGLAGVVRAGARVRGAVCRAA